MRADASCTGMYCAYFWVSGAKLTLNVQITTYFAIDAVQTGKYVRFLSYCSVELGTIFNGMRM